METDGGSAKERGERGNREVVKGKIERKKRERERVGNRWIESEKEREERRRYIKRDKGGGGSNRWWACERDREGERGDRDRIERERERGRPKDTPTYTDRDKLLTMNDS